MSALTAPALGHRATRKHIFVSIPRNASHTVHSVLGLEHPKNRSRRRDRAILDNHATCQVLRDRYGKAVFRKRFKFCFVRNPWERCVSWYDYHRRLEPYRDMSFRNWVLAGMPHHWITQNGTDYRASSPLFQHLFITDADGDLMVDRVGRLERFGHDMSAICARIGISPDPRLALHVPRSTGYRDRYDDETREAVRALLERDIQLFGYEF